VLLRGLGRPGQRRLAADLLLHRHGRDAQGVRCVCQDGRMDPVVIPLVQAEDIGVENEDGHGSAGPGGPLLGLPGVAVFLDRGEPVVEQRVIGQRDDRDWRGKAGYGLFD